MDIPEKRWPWDTRIDRTYLTANDVPGSGTPDVANPQGVFFSRRACGERALNDLKTRDAAPGPPYWSVRLGFGGLTVSRALLPQIPGRGVFLSGSHGATAVRIEVEGDRVSTRVESAQLLEAYGANYLVIACNTASARLALDAIRSQRTCSAGGD